MSNQAEALFQQGKSHFEQEKWDKAEQSFREAIKRDEANADYHAWLARTLAAMDKATLALEEVNIALELNPQCAIAYFVCGRVYDKKGEWDKAIQDYTRAIELDPQFAMAYNNRGGMFYNETEWDKAIQDYTRAIELDPKHANAYYYRSLAFHHKQEHDKAVQDYTRAIELDPKAKYPKYADTWLDESETEGWLSLLFKPRSYFQKKQALFEENHDFAFNYTGCRWLGSVFHLGGHPSLPYQQRVLLGIKSDSVRFYDYNLRLLHSVPLNEVQVAAETRHVTTSSFGTVYQPTNSSFGTTSSTQRIDMKPDTLRMALLVKGERVIADFDLRPIDPLNFVDTFNKAKLG